MDYHTHEEQVRAEIGKDEAIRHIEQLGGTYDPDSRFDLMDQLLICETLKDSIPVDPTDEDGRTILSLREEESKGNGSSNGSVNGGYKRTENTQLSQSKHEVIAKLKSCTYRTSPIITARLLEELFAEHPSKAGHWFYIAQHWPPRRINQVIGNLIKLDFLNNSGIGNPAAYFTFLIKKRTRRKAVYGIDKI
ncbi:MAG: hypothetical protein AAB492_05310 [Patescibacteria group bacterium]